MLQKCVPWVYIWRTDIWGIYKIKKCMGFYTGGRGFIFGVLRYIMILRFGLEAMYFHNNKNCCILLNNFFCLQLQKELNNGRDDLISGPYIFGQKGIVSVNK